MMPDSLSKEEVYRLRQLICEHTDTKEVDYKCSCCGEPHEEKCLSCGKELVTSYAKNCDEMHTESEDGYCNTCR